MSDALKVLDTLDLPWIPVEVTAQVRSELLKIQGQITDALRSVLRVRDAFDRSQHLISRTRYHLLCRVCAALLRSAHHTNNLTWHHTIQSFPALALHTLDAANICDEYLASEEVMKKELGEPLTHALLERFGSSRELLARFQEYREKSVSGKTDTPESEFHGMVQRAITDARTPDQMRWALRSLGLPGDCFRSMNWLRMLGLSQRRAMMHTWKTVHAVIARDARFTREGYFIGTSAKPSLTPGGDFGVSAGTMG